MILLEAKKLHKIYNTKNGKGGVHAVNDIDITIENGDFVAIMGSSGSGKTTLLNVLSGIDNFTSGNLRISDKDISLMTANELALFRRQNLGFVFQEFNLLDSLTIEENIMLPMILDQKDINEIEQKVNTTVKMFDIEDIVNKYPYEVSGGQQQRAAICRAIINDPEIIFADEPTGNLDSNASEKVMKCFQQLNEMKQIAIIMVTHDAFVASYCSKVIFIKDGQINNEIRKVNGKTEFFHNILDCLSQIGGNIDDK
ncbi:MAG: ABC transporter ATP-binding protein [Oscillospiraceae bacterium]|nr:ABC transporter ATP-binding protein [Oscillospiraceae bacterium]